MKSVFKLFSSKQTTVGKAALVLMVMVAASRMLGLFRDRLLSDRFTADELGIYFAAFRLPSILFELLVVGALTSAFIPVFTKYMSTERDQEGWKMASILINFSFLLLLIISLPLLIFTYQICQILAPGFSKEQLDLMVVFTRFMVLVQVVPLLIGNFFTGILQSFNLFLVPALAPVLYNVGIIIGIVFLSHHFGLYGPVIGVGIGALLFMLVQIPLMIKIGFRHQFSTDLKHDGVREVGKLMAPRTLGLAVSQIDTTVDLMLASLLGAKMVTVFNFAQHLQQLPVGLFGASIAQAALPIISQSWAKHEKIVFRDTLIRAINQILFLVIPISVLFIVLRIPIVRLVFGASQFDWESTVLTGMTLSTFSISLFAQSLIHILAHGFYAIYDTKTPVFVGIGSIVLNTILSIMFIMYYHLPVWSLGVSTSIATILQCVVLLYLLHVKIGSFHWSKFIISPLKMLCAAFIMGGVVYIPLKLFDILVFDTTRTFGLILLTGFSSVIGLCAYLFFSWVMGVGEVAFVTDLLKNIKRTRQVFLEPAREIIQNDATDSVT